MIKQAYFRGLIKAAGGYGQQNRQQSADTITDPKALAAKIREIVNAKPKPKPTSTPTVPRSQVLFNRGALKSALEAQKLIQPLPPPPPPPRPLSMPPLLETQQPVPPTHPAVSPAWLRPRLPQPKPVPAPYNKKA